MDRVSERILIIGTKLINYHSHFPSAFDGLRLLASYLALVPEFEKLFGRLLLVGCSHVLFQRRASLARTYRFRFFDELSPHGSHRDERIALEVVEISLQHLTTLINHQRLLGGLLRIDNIADF